MHSLCDKQTCGKNCIFRLTSQFVMHYLHTSCICCCGFSALWSMLKGFCLDCLASTSSNQSLNDSRPSRILPHLNKAPSNWHSLSVSCRNTTSQTYAAVDTLSLKKNTRGHNGQHDMGSPSRLHASELCCLLSLTSELLANNSLVRYMCLRDRSSKLVLSAIFVHK